MNPSTPSFSYLIKRARHLKSIKLGTKYTQKMLAADTGVSRSFLADLESGRTDPSSSLINKIIKACGISSDVFFDIEDSPQKYVPVFIPDVHPKRQKFKIKLGVTTSIPILGAITAGVPLYSMEHKLGAAEVPESLVEDGEYFFLIVQDNSMIGSRILSGDKALIKTQPVIDEGKIALVIANRNNATLRRIKYIDGTAILYSDNPSYEPSVYPAGDVQIVGYVVRVEFCPNEK